MGLGSLSCLRGPHRGAGEETLEKQGWCRQTTGCGVDVISETPAITRRQRADLGAWETGQGAGTRSADWDGVGTARTRWGGWECSLGVSGGTRCPRALSAVRTEGLRTGFASGRQQQTK